MGKTYAYCPHCGTLNRLDQDKALAKTPECGKCQKILHLDGLTSAVTAVQLERLIQKSELPVVVDFWAAWCGPCRMYGPIFKKVSEQVSDVVFVKVDTENEQEISTRLGIRGIPATILFKNGKEVKRQSGVMDEIQLKNWLLN